jgi:CheY-like chemotaxis protein
MATFKSFEACLKEALAHLYDPAFWPPDVLWEVAGCDPHQGLKPFQTAIIRAIEELKPASHVPQTARSRRIYGLLSLRYVQDLTQEETAERLGITTRHLRREQTEAIHALALLLWELDRSTEAFADETIVQTSDTRLSEYLSQVKQELASLQDSAPGAVADVGETIGAVVELDSALTAKRGIRLHLEHVPEKTTAAIHPTVLRQVLLRAVGRLSQLMSSGQITFSAYREQDTVTIVITGQPAVADKRPDSNFIREILGLQGGSVEASVEDGRISFQLELPSADLTVLVVDDNPDLFHLYRRYALGTRYRFVHAEQGEGVFALAEASRPDIIVLDVMLPDVDGWELLSQLRERAVTASIPVIICTVVREEELALALGAAHYLPKPVERRPFIQALDRVVSQAATRAPKSPANSVAAC